MKTSFFPRGISSKILSIISIAIIGSASAQQNIPIGQLLVDKTMVRVGTHSQLEWWIKYPTGIDNLVDVTKTGTIIPKKQLTMKVRTLGVAFQSGPKLLPVEGSWSKNGSTFKRFFFGTGPEVNPSKILIQQTVKKNDRIDFAGRGWSGKSWFPIHHTASQDPYVIVLKNGDMAPSYAPAYDQASVESFLSPYINGSGQIKIGPRDLIILWEASTAQPGSPYFDMQDLVVLVTFE